MTRLFFLFALTTQLSLAGNGPVSVCHEFDGQREVTFYAPLAKKVKPIAVLSHGDQRVLLSCELTSPTQIECALDSEDEDFVNLMAFRHASQQLLGTLSGSLSGVSFNSNLYCEGISKR